MCVYTHSVFVCIYKVYLLYDEWICLALRPEFLVFVE